MRWMRSNWWSRLQDSTPYLMVAFKSNGHQNQLKSMLVGILCTYGVIYVLCLIKTRDREEQVCDESHDGELVLAGEHRECEIRYQIGCMGSGAHHRLTSEVRGS